MRRAGGEACGLDLFNWNRSYYRREERSEGDAKYDEQDSDTVDPAQNDALNVAGNDELSVSFFRIIARLAVNPCSSFVLVVLSP